MIRTVIFCLCLATVLAINSGDKEARVVGGVNALPGEYPYIVSIQRIFLLFSTHICGGSILNNFHVLSAAQCFASIPTSRFRVQAGKLTLNQFEPQEQTINVLRAVLHPQYTGGYGPNNIAVVRLQSPFGFTDYIQPIALPVVNAIPDGVVRFAGFGSTSLGLFPSTPETLQQTRVAVFPNELCQFLVGEAGAAPVTSGEVCLGPLTGGIGACVGDMGGPVAQIVTGGQATLVGVLSWHPTPCGAPGVPTVSTRVSAYVQWINDNSVV